MSKFVSVSKLSGEEKAALYQHFKRAKPRIAAFLRMQLPGFKLQFGAVICAAQVDVDAARALVAGGGK